MPFFFAKMIEISQLSFSYPSDAGSRRPVFENLNLAVSAGSYVALMGPNGSGKSTLGKLVKGLLSPSSGSVRLAGKTLNPGEISPRVGYLFSNPENQIVSSLVEEDVAFGLGNRGMAPALMARRVEESLRQVGMEEYRRHPPHLLSGGQQQKVVLAGILAMECEIWVLDEPTSMLDPGDRREILDLFLEIHRSRGTTVLHITHSIEEALRAQSLIFLDGGRISFEGPPEGFLASERFPESFRLQLPPVFRLARGLRERGHDLPSEIRSLEELKKALLEKGAQRR